MRVLILPAIFTCLALGMLPAAASASELKVTNLSEIEIYPTVTSNNSSEHFGVIFVGGSKTVAFSPFKPGDRVQLLWEEGKSYHLSTAEIDTVTLQGVSSEVSGIHMIYQGNGAWVLKVFDRDDRETGSVP